MRVQKGKPLAWFFVELFLYDETEATRSDWHTETMGMSPLTHLCSIEYLFECHIGLHFDCDTWTRLGVTRRE